MVKSLERLEQRLAVMVAAQETSQAWSSLGEEGPVCFLFLFFQPSFAERQRATAGAWGWPQRAAAVRRGSGAGQERKRGGKWREVPERGSAARAGEGPGTGNGQGRGEPALLNEHICQNGLPFLLNCQPSNSFLPRIRGKCSVWGELKAICVRDSPEPAWRELAPAIGVLYFFLLFKQGLGDGCHPSHHVKRFPPAF